MATVDATYPSCNFRFCAFFAYVSISLLSQTSLYRKGYENARDDTKNRRRTNNEAGAKNSKNVDNGSHDSNSGNIDNNNHDNNNGNADSNNNNNDDADDDDNDDDDDDNVFASCVCYY